MGIFAGCYEQFELTIQQEQSHAKRPFQGLEPHLYKGLAL